MKEFSFSNKNFDVLRTQKTFTSSINFPQLEDDTNPIIEGIVAVGGVLDVGTLYHAYIRGIFPWPHHGYPNLWFCPEQRGVLEFNDFHVSRSLIKFRRQHPEYKLTMNRNFLEVMEQCSRQPRPGQSGTWINEEVKNGYHELFKEGFILSVECWDSSHHKDILVAGIYGVYVKGVFSGESMFHDCPNTSKLAFWYLVEFLRHHGLTWIDTQMVTPLVASFGGKYLSRKVYLEKLASRQKEWEAR